MGNETVILIFTKAISRVHYVPACLTTQSVSQSVRSPALGYSRARAVCETGGRALPLLLPLSSVSPHRPPPFVLCLLFSPPVLRLPLHEGVEEAGPGLVLAVVAQVGPDALREVEEHVPGVARDAAHAARVLRQEVQPALQHGRRVLREDEPPERHGDAPLQRALALLHVQAELEGEAVQVLEALLAPRLLQQHGEAAADALHAVGLDGAAALHELFPAEGAAKAEGEQKAGAKMGRRERERQRDKQEKTVSDEKRNSRNKAERTRT